MAGPGLAGKGMAGDVGATCFGGEDLGTSEVGILRGKEFRGNVWGLEVSVSGLCEPAVWDLEGAVPLLGSKSAR